MDNILQGIQKRQNVSCGSFDLVRQRMAVEDISRWIQWNTQKVIFPDGIIGQLKGKGFLFEQFEILGLMLPVHAGNPHLKLKAFMDKNNCNFSPLLFNAASVKVK